MLILLAFVVKEYFRKAYAKRTLKCVLGRECPLGFLMQWTFPRTLFMTISSVRLIIGLC